MQRVLGDRVSEGSLGGSPVLGRGSGGQSRLQKETACAKALSLASRVSEGCLGGPQGVRNAGAGPFRAQCPGRSPSRLVALSPLSLCPLRRPGGS